MRSAALPRGENDNAFRGGFRLWGGRPFPSGKTARNDALEPSEKVPQMAARSEISRPGPTGTLAAWRALADHHRAIQQHLRDLFADDPARGERMTAEAAGIFLDYSKNRIDDETLRLLVELAEQCGLRPGSTRCFEARRSTSPKIERCCTWRCGRREARPSSSTARTSCRSSCAVLDKMAAFANSVRSGQWKGHTGNPSATSSISASVARDLGPVMAYEALKYYSDRAMTFRFVSNVDGTDFVEATRDLDAAETLFIISSKTFTTLETMTNAHTARDWSLRGLAATPRRSPGISSPSRPMRKSREFGIDTANMFEFWDWVGGRYSDSAIGLSTMLVGPDHFRAMLEGFHAVDEHFRTAPFARNLPVLMGLFGVWYNDFFGAQTVAVLPYDQYLKRFPAYLQQLTMESNGKHVTLAGTPVDCRPVRSTGASPEPTASTPSIN